jgi:hypothetical protein
MKITLQGPTKVKQESEEARTARPRKANARRSETTPQTSPHHSDARGFYFT